MALAIPGSPKTNSLLAPECSFRKRFGRPVLAKAAWFIPTLSHGIKHQAAQGMWIHLHEPPVSSWDRENLWETLLLTNPTGHGCSEILGLALPRGFSWIHEAWDQLRAPSWQREVFPVGRGMGAAAGRSRGNCSSREISRGRLLGPPPKVWESSGAHQSIPAPLPRSFRRRHPRGWDGQRLQPAPK